MDQVKKLTEPGRQFAKDSIRLIKRCTKPDRKGEFLIVGQQGFISSSLVKPFPKPEWYRAKMNIR
ncbi:hypothetical protein E2986_12229 [Frieseomelitta varia]|uniref:Uncharacterized protein n=1 Tax=Frieseomelitta varia TaxID=561572 RepID=A0A833RKU6_9HYME|nr:hypothetical protein E2986_12229 [Frieseomelitta varia]